MDQLEKLLSKLRDKCTADRNNVFTNLVELQGVLPD